MKHSRYLAAALVTASAVLAPSLAPAAPPANAVGGTDLATYEVTVTNLTRAQVFSPLLVVTHSSDTRLFVPGAAASPELASLAEEGMNTGLAMLAASSAAVLDVQSGVAPLPPSMSETIVVRARADRPLLSLAGMLVNTNDAFVALDSFTLPQRGQTTTYAVAFDAGSEANSESCAYIPGPACNGGGAGMHDPAAAEGYVYVSNGVHGVGDLAPETYDWRNPVAAVTIRRR